MKFSKETTKGIVLGSTLTLALVAGMNNVSAAGITKLIEATFNNVKVNVEGKMLNLVDVDGNKVEPFIVEGTTYLPVRAIAEGLGKSVKWDNTTNTVHISNNNTKDNGVKFVASETEKNKALEEDIIKVLKLDDDAAQKTRYYYNYIDLNGDGVKEVFVQLVGPSTSGTGGDTGLILKQKNNSFELVQKFTLIRNPIIVSSGKTNEWNDLILEVSGGGAKAHRVQLKFDGTKYPNLGDGLEMDENTNVEGTGIIQNDIRADFETGKGLFLK
jgi:hypothetical protein